MATSMATPSIPKNVLFEIDDAEDEWTFSAKFDYIHGRALVTCFKDPRSVIQQAYNALRPGGFLEYQDGAFPMQYIGDVPTESALERWNGLVTEAAGKLGRDFSCAHNYRRWFEEVGFENVTERRFYWPMGQWVKGQYYKQLAAYCSEDLKGGLEAISQKMYRFVGMSQDEMKAMANEAREDLNNPKIHAYVPV
jgi:SAM-dependent methyltransferase